MKTQNKLRVSQFHIHYRISSMSIASFYLFIVKGNVSNQNRTSIHVNVTSLMIVKEIRYM